jgi:hypothetical protein
MRARGCASLAILALLSVVASCIPPREVDESLRQSTVFATEGATGRALQVREAEDDDAVVLVAVFASWEKIERAASVDPGRLVVSTGRSYRSHEDSLQDDGEHTTVIVTADHGRGRDYRVHGRAFPESARVWLVAAGGAPLDELFAPPPGRSAALP